MNLRPFNLSALLSGAACGLALGLLFGMQKGLLTGEACRFVASAGGARDISAFWGCAEFRFARYQTLAAGVAATVAAAATVVYLRRQTTNAEKQALHTVSRAILRETEETLGKGSQAIHAFRYLIGQGIWHLERGDVDSVLAALDRYEASPFFPRAMSMLDETTRSELFRELYALRGVDPTQTIPARNRLAAVGNDVSRKLRDRQRKEAERSARLMTSWLEVGRPEDILPDAEPHPNGSSSGGAATIPVPPTSTSSNESTPE